MTPQPRLQVELSGSSVECCAEEITFRIQQAARGSSPLAALFPSVRDVLFVRCVDREENSTAHSAQLRRRWYCAELSDSVKYSACGAGQTPPGDVPSAPSGNVKSVVNVPVVLILKRVPPLPGL